ncbi:MAG: hypothetical protein H7259_01260 [Cytophagales bacterium]|nr:hypothetical protein [Cytophaga sp.]
MSIIQLSAYDEFTETNTSKLIVWVNDSNRTHNYYWHDPFLIHFPERTMNAWQTGQYDFAFAPITDTIPKTVGVEIVTRDESCDVQNVKLRFLKLK